MNMAILELKQHMMEFLWEVENKCRKKENIEILKIIKDGKAPAIDEISISRIVKSN